MKPQQKLLLADLAVALTQRLADADAAEDWQALAAADKALAAALPDFARAAPHEAPEWGALAALRQAHRKALAHCAQEAGRLGDRLDAMRQHKDGWIAYALNQDSDNFDGELA